MLEALSAAWRYLFTRLLWIPSSRIGSAECFAFRLGGAKRRRTSSPARRKGALDRASAALFIASLSLALAGCSQLHLTQAEDSVIFRTANYDSYSATNFKGFAGPAAARLAPFALIAEQSEAKEPYLGKGLAPPPKCEPAEAGECVDRAPDLLRARAMLGRWRLAWHCDGRKSCGVAKPDDGGVDGLGVQIWLTRGSVCTEAIIAFRGTQGFSEGDWRSNFHWFYRLTPVYDQYDEVRDHIKDWVAYVKNQACYRPGVTQIATLGHSLGGGLAQMAAYANGEVQHVYAFDPSPVTGYYSGGLAARDENVKGLRTERVYEHNEVLAFVRFAQRQFVPLTNCDARIVSTRFKVLEGGPLTAHSSSSLATGLLRVSRGVAPEPYPLIARPCRKGEPEPDWDKTLTPAVAGR